jgi:branched-chain amino acid transport system substrate-binding protein
MRTVIRSRMDGLSGGHAGGRDGVPEPPRTCALDVGQVSGEWPLTFRQLPVARRFSGRNYHRYPQTRRVVATQKEKRMTKLHTLAAVALCCAAAVIAGCGSSDDDNSAGSGGNSGTASNGESKTLRVGFSAALSGDYAAYDTPVLDGMKYAAKKINAAGGDDGIKVEISALDNHSEQNATTTTTQSLLDKDIRAFVLTSSAANIAQGTLIAGRGGMTTLGLVTTPSVAHSIGDRAFLVGASADNAQASVGAQYACDQGYKTAATLGSPDLPYTNDMPGYFADAFDHICGGKVISEGTFKIGATDFSSQVSKVTQAKPDVVFSAIFVPDSIAFLKQLRSAGSKTPFIGTDGNDSPDFIKSGGSATEGAAYTVEAFPEGNARLEDFIADYEKLMGKAPEAPAYNALGADQVTALVEAAKLSGGSVEPDDLVNGMLKLKNVPLLTGDSTMSADTRIAEKGVPLIQVDGGKNKLVSDDKPSYIAAPK